MNCEPELIRYDLIERLIQPYSESSLDILRKDLMDDPELRYIHVWRNSHLSDKERFEICREYGIRFSMEEMNFRSIDEAAIYVCKNEIERPDLAPEYRKYLIGQRYHHEYNLHAESGKNDSKLSVAGIIAEELNISAGTVLKYALYASAVNVIFDEDTAFAKDILIGRLKISHENIIELSRLRPEEIRSIAKSSYNEKSGHITLSFIRNEVKWSHVLPRNPVSKRERAEEHMRIKPAIRQMPEYDPDSEVNSLCMTIDSWISSIKRVNNSENFPKITHTASLRLMKKLSQLENTITQVQESLVERTGE